jgi:transcriptional regulator with XRE-family HTH domain
MRAQNVSQRQLGARAGVDHATISRLLRGQRTPVLTTAIRLAQALERPPDAYMHPKPPPGTPASRSIAALRVEDALRADPILSDSRVRRIMEYYRAVRRQRVTDNGKA